MEKFNCSIEDISKELINEFSAIEITVEELVKQSECIYEDIDKNTTKIYIINDENTIESLLSESEKEEILITIEHFRKNGLDKDNVDEICMEFMNKISTGKLIVITLESEDNVNLSGFTMQGSGEKLYNYLLALTGETFEKNNNLLDETIYELKQFRPYGKFFK